MTAFHLVTMDMVIQVWAFLLVMLVVVMEDLVEKCPVYYHQKNLVYPKNRLTILALVVIALFVELLVQETGLAHQQFCYYYLYHQYHLVLCLFVFEWFDCNLAL